MRDTASGGCRDDGFGVVGHTQSRSPDHVEIVGPVPYREGIVKSDAKPPHRVFQRLEFRFTTKDWFSDCTSQMFAVIQQPVAVILLKTSRRRDPRGEETEPAGDQQRMRAVGTHGGRQAPGHPG